MLKVGVLLRWKALRAFREADHDLLLLKVVHDTIKIYLQPLMTDDLSNNYSLSDLAIMARYHGISLNQPVTELLAAISTANKDHYNRQMAGMPGVNPQEQLTTLPVLESMVPRLSLKDLTQLCQTNQRFAQECRGDHIWRIWIQAQIPKIPSGRVKGYKNPLLALRKHAIKHDHVGAIKALIADYKPGTNKKKLWPDVIKAGAPNLTQFLLDQGVSKKQLTEGLCIANDLAIVKMLLGAGANPNKYCSDGNTALMSAVKNKNLPKVQELLSAGADPNVAGEETGFTPLLIAVENRDLDTIRILLAADADPNLQDVDGRTALMEAGRIDFDGPEIAQTLLEAGANPDIQDAQGSTALIYAVNNGLFQVTKTLLAAGADPNIKNVEGNTALLVVVRWPPNRRFPDIVKVLLDAGADPNVQDKDTRTPLIYAIQRGKLNAVKMLIKAGADLTLTTIYGSTAIHYARDSRKYYRDKKYHEIEKYIEQQIRKKKS